MNQSMDKILLKQRKFFAEGTTKQYGFRMAALLRLEKALVEYEEALCEALYADLHKSQAESFLTEIGMVKTELRYMKKHLYSFMKPKACMPDIAQLPGTTFTMAEPYGVVLVMAPWNYPVLLCLDPLIDAIAAGNCVVLKPSAYAPHVSAVLKEMLESIFPKKYVAVIEGGREENAALLEQRFDYIFFTGGVTVGKLVLEKAAKYVTPVTLELGGKSPCIVDKSADLQAAARRVAFGKLLNAGQTCIAPDYLLVHEDVKTVFLLLLEKEVENMQRGNTSGRNTSQGEETVYQSAALQNPDYPRIVNEKHFHRICKLMEGENIVFGGESNPETLQIAPTVLDNVTLDSPVMQEEIFGPILPVMTYATPADLKRIIGSFEKPLAFYLFTQDKGMQSWVLRTFSFGGGCINNTILHLATSHMPFGGVGFSGMGGYHGKAGFETFSHRKSVLNSWIHPDIPFRYQPFEEWKDDIIRKIL